MVSPVATTPGVSQAINPLEVWREAKAPNTGRLYYYKKQSRDTTWVKPAIYIPLGGTVPINAHDGSPADLSGGAAPVSGSPAPTPVPETAPQQVNQLQQPTSNTTQSQSIPHHTPLTGFQLSGLSGTTPTTSALSSSASNENPGLLAHSGATPTNNPALYGATNPALGGTNPALASSGSSQPQTTPVLSNTTSTGMLNANQQGANAALAGSSASLSNSSNSVAMTASASNPALVMMGDMSNNGGTPGTGTPQAGSAAQTPRYGTGGADSVAGASSLSNGMSAINIAGAAGGSTDSPQQYSPATSDAIVAAPAAPVEPTFDPTANEMIQDAATGIWYNPMTGVQYDASSGTQFDPMTQAYVHVGFPPPSSPAHCQIGVPYDPSQANASGLGVYDPNTKAFVYPVPPAPPASQNGSIASINGTDGNGSQAGSISAATSSAPAPPAFPKTLRVRLPADQRQVVPFKAEQTLRAVLTKICTARGLSIDDYLAKDRSGMDINLDRTLGDINQEEVSFLTPRAGIVPQDETKRKAHKLMSDIYEANAGLSSSLQTIVKNYRDPLLKSAQDVDMRKRLLSEQECNQIFASIESITSMTKEFVSHLSTQLSVWPVDLTDMITRHHEVLTFYHEFVNNYRQNMNKLEDLRRNADFSAFVDGVQRGMGSKLRLEDFLALPAVKIAATNALIDQLILILTDQHPNYFMLRDFQQRLSPIANQATALRLQMEARSKIVWLEANIAKFPKQKGIFLHDQRIFFRDGVFELGIGGKKKPQLCYVALFTDLMIVCKAPEKKKKDKPATPPSYEEFIAFAPTGCSVEEVGSQGWNLHIDGSAGKGKISVSCVIHTSSEHAKPEWVKSFKDAFHDFSGKPHLKPPVL